MTGRIGNREDLIAFWHGLVSEAEVARETERIEKRS
jgi:hypothetical protein